MNKMLLSFILLFLTAITFAAPKSKENKTPVAPVAPPVTLQILEKEIQIDGKTAKIFTILQPDGTFGYVGNKGDTFDAIVQNKTNETAILHWHGLTVPNSEDGAPFITQAPIPPGKEYHYRFKLNQAGTFWVHSHYQGQLQKLMAAPFIVQNPSQKTTDKNVVMFLQDFTFSPPQEAYTQLRRKFMEKTSDIQLSSAGGNQANTADVSMDAYLTNHRTLSDPEIVWITPNQTVMLRIINASANTNFFINLGNLKGKLVAVDSGVIQPIEGSIFQVGQGQRLDIEVTLPEGENYYPILAQAEGTSKQTGLILATPNTFLPKFNSIAPSRAPAFNYDQEMSLRTLTGIPHKDLGNQFLIDLGGNMLSYVWTINNEVWPKVTPLRIRPDEQVELILQNKTEIPVSMHLHGHVFQVTEINGTPINGAVRDTILVLPHSTIKIRFNADNPGVWLLRGYVPYQNYGGMITTINYDGYETPIFREKDTAVPPANTQ